MRLLQAQRLRQAGKRSGFGGLHVVDTTLVPDVRHALMDRRVLARLRNVRDSRRNGVQVDLRAGRQQRFFIEDRDALEARLCNRWRSVAN